MRFLGCAAAAAMTMLLLSGCGSLATQPTTTPTITVAPPASSPAISTPTPTPPPAPSATPTGTTPTNPEPAGTQAAIDPDRPAGQCPDDVIAVSVGPQRNASAAGNAVATVYFVNTGGASCVLRGTPSVSVVASTTGPQLGVPAERVQTGATSVSLPSGGTAVATLTLIRIGTNGGSLQGCTVKKGAGYRVFPPHSEKAFFFQDPTAVACAPGPVFMTVGPVRKSAG